MSTRFYKAKFDVSAVQDSCLQIIWIINNCHFNTFGIDEHSMFLKEYYEAMMRLPVSLIFFTCVCFLFIVIHNFYITSALYMHRNKVLRQISTLHWMKMDHACKIDGHDVCSFAYRNPYTLKMNEQSAHYGKFKHWI